MSPTILNVFCLEIGSIYYFPWGSADQIVRALADVVATKLGIVILLLVRM